MAFDRISFDLDYVFSLEFHVALEDKDIIGPTMGGLRLNFRITGGDLTGPFLNGKILPVGGDWVTVLPDGTVLLDVHATVDVGLPVCLGLVYKGRGDAGRTAYDDFLMGKLPDRPIPLRANVQVEAAAADDKAKELARRFYLGIGEADIPNQRVRYDVYWVGPDFVTPGTDFTGDDLP